MKLHALCWPLLVLGTLAQAQVPREGVEFSHKDWDLVCLRTGTCVAMGYSPGDSLDGISLALNREAGPRTSFTGNLLFADLAGDPPTTPVSLVLDDELVASAKEHGPRDFMLDEYASRRLVNALAGNTRIRFVDALGHAWPLSGAGATAVLLKMDELQERLGTPTAAVRRGDEDEDLVPGPERASPPISHPPLLDTRVEDARLADDPSLRQALAAAVAPHQPCPALHAEPLLIERLDEHRLLVSTQCAANSYNTATGFWVAEDRPPYLASLVTEAGTRFDRARATIGSWQMQSPRGDCMKRAFWTWDGTRFVLTYRANYVRCRGFRDGAWSVPSYVN
ncbi:DUF1176 domain-containing protein [Pseudomonas sp. RIT623]|uniref:DUF1176 domain-containing protein n=1 Tax=Pseudomonas sp. RIT623 TaxID=2559075 RepID=UPI00106FDC70|nr:DUF1176 domain-containing protein [Pseudomonas sp. RIT623]TFF39397.1 DUF1176 domain-containing protein [Pseudomonas sp. RIT623]